MKKTLKARIDEAITQVEKASESLNAHPFLPYIKLGLEAMRDGLTLPREEREGMSAGMGKLMLDDDAFAESELGTMLFELKADFASGDERG